MSVKNETYSYIFLGKRKLLVGCFFNGLAPMMAVWTSRLLRAGSGVQGRAENSGLHGCLAVWSVRVLRAGSKGPSGQRAR